MVKVKICGITNLGDALHAVREGADALGFMFYRASPRYIDPLKAKDIIKRIPKDIIKIGVFVNSGRERVLRIAKLCRLDMLQFHGNESASYCDKFRGYKVIKAFRVKDKIREDLLLRYNVFAYLFDAYTKGKFGGTGRHFDWRLVRHLGNLKKPVFISGGLNQKNVLKAAAIARPHWIDVSSSLESLPGKKDHLKVSRFLRHLKSVKR